MPDPTPNVLDLVAAAISRQDDLRDADTKLSDERIKHVEEMAELRAQKDKELREAESGRIDAIRAVDVGAVAAAAQVAEQRANTLAAQVSTTADAFRATLATALEPIQKDIRDVRDKQSSDTGLRSAPNDPTLLAINELREEQGRRASALAQTVTDKTEGRAKSNLTGVWIGLGVAAVIGIGSLFIAAAGIVVTIILLHHN
jgi:hypothetical protein